MAKKKLSRKELLKGPDEFLTVSERAVIFIREHLRQFQYVGVAIAALILIYLGINGYLRYINKKGQQAYNSAYYSLVKTLNEDADQEGLEKSRELFQKVIDDYGFSKVSRLAAPEIANIKFREKKYDEAIALYREYMKEVPEKSPYETLAKLALSACYEAKGEFSAAVDLLKEILSETGDFFKEQAMLALARVYRLSSQSEKSKEILQEFVGKYKDSPFAAVAKAHLSK